MTRARRGGRLPVRYRTNSIDEPLVARARELVGPGVAVLDIGGGRRPLVRPENGMLVGLDVSEEELAFGGYDRAIVALAEDFQPDLVESFDVVVCCYTLEHVRDTRQVLRNTFLYLRPGGILLALTSGKWAAHSVINRLVPHRIGAHLTGRPAETVFPARYDRCTARELEEELAAWSHAQVTPTWVDANYFPAPLRRVYLKYEEWALRHPDLASHYYIEARR